MLWFLCAYRFVLGLGSEALYIAMESLLTDRFRAFEISFAYASIFSAAQCGSFVIFVWGPAWSGAEADAAALIPVPSTSSPPLVGPSDGGFVQVFWLAAAVSCTAYLFNVAFWLWDERCAAPAHSYEAVESPDGSSEERVGVFSVLSFLRRSSGVVWCVLLLIVVYCVTVFPFQEFAPDFLESGWHVSVSRAGQLTGLLSLVSMLWGPCVGAAVDRIGHRSLLVCLTWLLAVVGFVAIGFPQAPVNALGMSPVVAMTSLAVALSTIQSVLWSLLPLVIPDSAMYAVVYGLVFCVMNAGQIAVYWVGGDLTAADPTYSTFFIGFIALWGVGLVLSLLSLCRYPYTADTAAHSEEQEIDISSTRSNKPAYVAHTPPTLYHC